MAFNGANLKKNGEVFALKMTNCRLLERFRQIKMKRNTPEASEDF